MANTLWEPPEIRPAPPDARFIFMHGPIQGAPDWQAEAFDIFNELDDELYIASPRHDYALDEFVYEGQVDWETHYRNLTRPGGVMMYWLAKQVVKTPDRAYAQTSRFELGEDFGIAKTEVSLGMTLVVGIEHGFGNERYIRRRFGQDLPQVPILDHLRDTCEVVLELLDD